MAKPVLIRMRRSTNSTVALGSPQKSSRNPWNAFALCHYFFDENGKTVIVDSETYITMITTFYKLILHERRNTSGECGLSARWRHHCAYSKCVDDVYPQHVPVTLALVTCRGHLDYPIFLFAIFSCKGISMFTLASREMWSSRKGQWDTKSF